MAFNNPRYPLEGNYSGRGFPQGIHPSTPCRMMGWRSTLGELHISGWKHEVFQDPCAFRSIVRVHNEYIALQGFSMDMEMNDLMDGSQPIIWNSISPKVEVVKNGQFDLTRFQPLSENMTAEIYSPEWVDFQKHYDSVNGSTDIVFDLNDYSVEDHLKAIMDKQQDTQDRLRKEAHNPKANIKKFQLIGVA